MDTAQFIVFTASFLNTLWALHRHDWKWVQTGLLPQVFGFQRNAFVDVCDFPMTLFVAATAGGILGYCINAVITYLPPIMTSTVIGVVIVEILKHIRPFRRLIPDTPRPSLIVPSSPVTPASSPVEEPPAPVTPVSSPVEESLVPPAPKKSPVASTPERLLDEVQKELKFD